jgi:3-oxoacyl-[acyl-carrier protein] reductase
MPLLAGQTALITGGSRGIGRAVAVTLAREGADILLHYHRNRDAAHEVGKEIGKPVRFLQADLGSARAIDGMVADLGTTPIDILVNNAGIWGSTPLGSTPLEELEAMLNLNIKGMFWLTQVALPLLREGARIVNISSVAGRLATPGGRSAYGASKAAVDAFTRNWALELAPRKIRVNAVAPGYVETDMTETYFSDGQRLESAIQRTPFKRLGNTQEVADTVLFLCSDAARWIVGQSINVSGGFVV